MGLGQPPSRWDLRRIAQWIEGEERARQSSRHGLSPIHQAWTIPPSGNARRGLRQTHLSGEENRIWVAPIQITGGYLRAKWISAAVGSPRCQSSNGGWAMALYQASKPTRGMNHINPVDPILSPQSKIELLTKDARIVKSRLYPLRANPGAQQMYRLDCILNDEAELRPERIYYVAFQSETPESYWFCPVNSGDFLGSVPAIARKTYSTPGLALGKFPDSLEMIMGGQYDQVCVDIPSIVIRSARGVHWFDAPVTYMQNFATEEDDVPAAYGQINISSSANTTVTTAGTPVLLAGTTTLRKNKLVSSPSNMRLRYDGPLPRQFRITMMFAIRLVSGTDPNSAKIHIYKNGATLAASGGFIEQEVNSAGGSETHMISIAFYEDLNPGDYIEAYLDSYSDGDVMSADWGHIDMWSMT